jgi:glycosyltransferase involved in cell wall biosynthesis
VDELDDKIAGKRIPDHTHEKHRLLLHDERCIVIATADKLYREVRTQRSCNCALVTNGVDLEHFARRFSAADMPPELQLIVKGGRKIIGYFGALASWVDYELILNIVRQRPDFEVVLIGFDYDGSSEPYRLEQEPRIHVLGPVDYSALPRYAYWLDVATIPFRINAITESTSPIKLFEYMALGKPIVTTALPECRKYRSVLVAEDGDDFLAKLDLALSLREDEAYRTVLWQEAQQNRWEEKAAQIATLIRQNLAATGQVG